MSLLTSAGNFQGERITRQELMTTKSRETARFSAPDPLSPAAHVAYRPTSGRCGALGGLLRF